MSDPAVEAAERQLANQFDGWPKGRAYADGKPFYSVRVRTEAAREALKPIRELHRRDGDYCWSCDHASWPCPTARLLYTPEELGEGNS